MCASLVHLQTPRVAESRLVVRAGTRKAFPRLVVLALLVSGAIWVFPCTSGAAEVYVLALEGDGSGSVTIDQAAKVAYITDGGRFGDTGIKSARINGMPVLEYLIKSGIENLAIICSHPHLDHMGGLRELVSSDRRITEFKKVLFVDSNHLSGQPSLYSIFAKSWPKAAKDKARFQYSSADDRNALANFGKTLRNRTVDVSNFVYSSKELGHDAHDRAVITQYQLREPYGKPMEFVDFDDASTRLINRWVSERGAEVTALIVPHHGSRNNRIADILARKDEFGLKSAVIAVNRQNRFMHPDADVLYSLVDTLGPDHVFVTDSDVGDNVVVDVNGIHLSDGDTARESLQEFIRARIAQHEHILREIVKNHGAVVASSLIASPAGMSFRGQVSSVRKRLIRAGLSTGEARDAAKSLVSMTWLNRTLEEMGDKSESADNRWWIVALAAGAPPEEDGSGRGSLGPASGLPGGGVAEYESKFQSSGYVGETTLKSRGARGVGGVGGVGAGGGGAYFQAMLSSPWPVWGGVIVGNRVTGPVPRYMKFVWLNGADVEIFVRTERGIIGYFGPVASSELWSAYNFVAPTHSLKERIGWNIPPDAVGLVGMTRNDRNTHVWTFAVHPAIADTIIARYAMRLDMSIAAAAYTAATGHIVPGAFSGTNWAGIKFITYQWYDVPSQIHVKGGRISVEAADSPSECLIHLRLVTIDKAKEPAWMSSDEARKREFIRRVKQRLEQQREFRQQFGPQYWQQSGERYGEEYGRQYGQQLAPQIGQLLRQESGRQLNDAPIRFGNGAFEDQSSLNAIAREVAIEMRRDEMAAIDNAAVQTAFPSRAIGRLCDGYDAYQEINQFAKLVAVLNWYRGSRGTLPPLPADLVPNFVHVGNRESLDDVLDGRFPSPYLH